MKDLGEFLKLKRLSIGLSLREASRQSGVSHTHIRDVEDSRSVPSFSMVMKFLKVYRIDIEEFLKKTGYLPDNVEISSSRDAKRVPVISWTQAGNWKEMCNGSQSGDHDQYVETDTNAVFALTVQGDSMEMEFYEGDTIIINPFIKPEHNDFVVVSNEEGEATFKQLKKYGKTRVLHPLNPKYDDIELSKEVEYRIIGVVLEKKKRYR